MMILEVFSNPRFHDPKRGAPATRAPSAQPQSCHRPAHVPVPVPGRGQLFLAGTKLLHTRIITPSQSSSGGRGRCGAALSLLPGIFSCGPGWERAWPQRCGHSPEEEPGPAAPPGSSGRTMARRGWKSAPASRGWRRESGWAVQPLGDPAGGEPCPLPGTGDATHGALEWPGAPVASPRHQHPHQARVEPSLQGRGIFPKSTSLPL